MTFDYQKIADLCRAHDIALLRIFGSAARGEERDDSDVDLLVRFSGRKTLLDLIRIEEEFERALGRKVDLVTEAALSPYIRDRVLQEARVLYEFAA
jgi:uncharacterized protein